MLNKLPFLTSEIHLRQQVPTLPGTQDIPQKKRRLPKHPHSFDLSPVAQERHSVPFCHRQTGDPGDPRDETQEAPAAPAAAALAACRLPQSSWSQLLSGGGRTGKVFFLFLTFILTSSAKETKQKTTKKKTQHQTKQKKALLNTRFSTVPFPKQTLPSPWGRGKPPTKEPHPARGGPAGRPGRDPIPRPRSRRGLGAPRSRAGPKPFPGLRNPHRRAGAERGGPGPQPPDRPGPSCAPPNPRPSAGTCVAPRPLLPSGPAPQPPQRPGSRRPRLRRRPARPPPHLPGAARSRPGRTAATGQPGAVTSAGSQRRAALPLPRGRLPMAAPPAPLSSRRLSPPLTTPRAAASQRQRYATGVGSPRAHAPPATPPA